MKASAQSLDNVCLNSFSSLENGYISTSDGNTRNGDNNTMSDTRTDNTKIEFPNADKQFHLRKKRRAQLATACILLLQMSERVTYYSVVANMVLFCTNSLNYDTVDATTISLVFSGCVYLMPVLGGYVSDSWAGRFLTLLISCILILVGIALLIVTAIESSQWLEHINQAGRRILFVVGLVLIAIGTGGVKANVSPFGAEQVEYLGQDTVNSFFNWFYWITAVGSVIAYTGVAYIQQNISFVWGFVTPLITMLSAVLVFVMAKPLYSTSTPEGSALKMFFSVVHQGLWRSGKTPQAREHSKTSGATDKTLGENNFFNGARLKYGGDHEDVSVDGVVSVIKILPFCALVIMFWAIYSQTQSSFFIQALRMDVRVADINIPAAMISTFTNLSIVLIIPVLDRVIYPCMLKLGLPMTLLRRIGIGLMFSTLAVVVAGVVEIYRKESLFKPGGSHIQTLADKNFTASSMSVFVQSPQFILVGIGEIFTAATTLEAGYTQAPPNMQGLLTGLFYAASGIGNFLSLGIMRVVEKLTEQDPWWGNEINNTKMENLMFLLAGLMAIDFIIFCIIAFQKSYKNMRAFNPEATQTSEIEESI